LADTRLKLAVFIDFDNIEIGVKSTLGTQFDIGVVLEALKERGEVVSKIAYGDWTRAGDYSRSLTQHATKLVQRNLTPGGDKNGADINLALDALEMAFTHTHINAYVIVGGDSDFITLVEKLKQYDKQTFVVGGRAFTSVVMQRNCHEFIAYENLVSSSRRGADRGRQPGPAGAQSPIDQVVPLVRRALKVLSDREVSPQLGLLKSTLLQLDSTFSERTYGVGSFRDFAQKLATAGHVRLREHGRNVLVELADGDGHMRSDDTVAPAPGAHEPRDSQPRDSQPRDAQPRDSQGRESHPRDSQPRDSQPRDSQPRDSQPRDASYSREPQQVDLNPPPGGEPRAADGIRAVRRIFQTAPNPPRFPMYVRQAKQFMRGVEPQFDERTYGFGTLQDLLRACQREGLFRIERDRQGVIRLFPGNIMQPSTGADDPEEELQRDVIEAPVAESAQGWGRDEAQGIARAPEPADDEGGEPADDQRGERAGSAEAQGGEVVDGDVVQEMDVQQVVDGEEAPAAEEPKRARGARKRTAQPRAAKKTEAAAPRARKTAAKTRAPRSRKTTGEG
jgi:uncharacterized LabA/DUF88 family protein